MANPLSALHNTTEVCVAFSASPQAGISINCLILQLVFSFKSEEGQFEENVAKQDRSQKYVYLNNNKSDSVAKTFEASSIIP